MNQREQKEHEIEMDRQQIRVAKCRIKLNLRDLDRLNKRETEVFTKLQNKGLTNDSK